MVRIIQQFFWILAISAAIMICLYPYRKRTLNAMHLSSGSWREWALFLFVLVLSGIVIFKWKPVSYQMKTEGVWGDILLLVDRPSLDYQVNLIPFSMVMDYYRNITQYGSADLMGMLCNILENVLLFVPVGLLPEILFRNGTWKRSVSLGFGLSLLTEVGQYFLVRNVSIDDVILNTLGALCGYQLYNLLRKTKPEFVEKFLVQEKACVV